MKKWRKRVLPPFSVQSKKTKVKKPRNSEENDQALINSWKEWFNRLNNNEDAKRDGFGDFPYHFVVYLYNCVRTGQKGKYNPTPSQAKFICDLSGNSKKEAKEFINVKLELGQVHMQGIKRRDNVMLFKRTLVPAKQSKGIITHPYPVLLELKEFVHIEIFK